MTTEMITCEKCKDLPTDEGCTYCGREFQLKDGSQAKNKSLDYEGNVPDCIIFDMLLT
jgi:hypothetical protein